jgi:hypothetical protein
MNLYEKRLKICYLAPDVENREQSKVLTRLDEWTYVRRQPRMGSQLAYKAGGFRDDR